MRVYLFPENAYDGYAPLAVRIVEPGEHYGLRDCRTHDGTEALVEFYDTRYPHTVWGQFTARYYLSTIMDFTPGSALNLIGHEPDWTAGAETMRKLREILSTIKPAQP